MAYQSMENYGMVGDMPPVTVAGRNASIDGLCHVKRAFDEHRRDTTDRNAPKNRDASV